MTPAISITIDKDRSVVLSRVGIGRTRQFRNGGGCFLLLGEGGWRGFWLVFWHEWVAAGAAGAGDALVVNEHGGAGLEYCLVAVGLSAAESVHRELHVLGEERRVQAVEVGVDLAGFDALHRGPRDRFRRIATEEVLHAFDIADVFAGTAVGA